MRTSIFLIVFMLVAFASNAQYFSADTLLFDNDKYDLSVSSTEKLNKLTAKLKADQRFQISLAGFTDNNHTAAYNEMLSEKRVQSVRSFLLSKGIKDKWIRKEHFGENNPIASNDDDAGRQKNRRVEIRVDFYPEIRKQSYLFNPNQDTTIIGKHGTFVHIAANSFMFENGSEPSGKIDFKMKEVFSYSDMILENINTKSDNKLLETGGMLYLEASSDGKKLVLKPDSRLTLYFPFKQRVDDMMLFEGEQHSAQDIINWKADSTSRAIFKNRWKSSDSSDFYHDPPFNYPAFKFVPETYKIPFYKKVLLSLHLINRENYMSGLEYEDSEKQLAVYNKAYRKAKQKWDADLPVRQTLWLNQKKNYEEFNKKLLGVSNEVVKKLDISTLENHILTTKSLGWMNCDRFSKIPEDQKVTYIVNDPDGNANVKLVMKNFKSCITGTRKGTQLIFTSVPKNEPVVIIGLIQNGEQPLLGMFEDVVTDKEVKDIICKPVTYSELTKKLKTLDI